jgi:ATP synthase protein I
MGQESNEMPAKSLKNAVQSRAYKIVFWQLLGILIVSCFALPLSGTRSAFSIFLGGMAYGLPNLFFVWRVFRFVRAGEMGTFLLAFFIGEMLKLILCGIFVLLIVKYLPVSLLSVVVGMACAIILFWIVSMIMFSKQTEWRAL